jgi:hypothetical protein
MPSLWLMLLLIAQVEPPPPSFGYIEGTACADRVLVWERNWSEVLSITLPGDARDLNSRSFQVGSGRGNVDVRVFFSTGGFHKCGQDLGPSFDEVLSGDPAWTAISGSALVYLSERNTMITVVLRDVTFKSAGRRFMVPKVLRVTTELNNTVAG